MYVQVPQWADDWAVCAVDIPDAKCHWYVMAPDNTFGEGFDWESAPWFDANGLGDVYKRQEQKLDPTFIASVFTGTLATFGVQAAGKKKAASDGGGSANISKKDMEFLIAKASETAPAQTIRIESAPVKIVPDSK